MQKNMLCSNLLHANTWVGTCKLYACMYYIQLWIFATKLGTLHVLLKTHSCTCTVFACFVFKVFAWKGFLWALCNVSILCACFCVCMCICECVCVCLHAFPGGGKRGQCAARGPESGVKETGRKWQTSTLPLLSWMETWTHMHTHTHSLLLLWLWQKSHVQDLRHRMETAVLGEQKKSTERRGRKRRKGKGMRTMKEEKKWKILKETPQKLMFVHK